MLRSSRKILASFPYSLILSTSMTVLKFSCLLPMTSIYDSAVVGLISMLGQVWISDTGSKLVTGTGWWHGSTWFQASTWWLCWRPPTSGHQWAPPLLPPPLSTLSTFLPLSGTLAKLAEHPPGGESGIYKPSALLSDSPHPALAATVRPPPWGWTANKNISSVSASVINHIAIINFGPK